MPGKRAFAVRVVGGMVPTLTIMDNGERVVQVSGVVFDGPGHELAGLGGCECGAFF